MDDHLLRAAFADLNLVKTNEFVICFTNHKLVYFDLGTSVCLERLYRRVWISTNNVRAQSILHNDSRQFGVAYGRDFERILGNALRGRHRELTTMPLCQGTAKSGAKAALVSKYQRPLFDGALRISLRNQIAEVARITNF